ncbi:MAG: NADH-quinone oxidoreductase subunit NuoE [Chloroflexi bacterium]|jgi:NADH:ubiquinone oxidoreductase subunit E|nr:NADH-quinone oxidoreductase subunit NuoE [Chloroflexota bacterium]MBT7081660.1 NADH-quinone oxidoreductase subunit NuoE [Chloroflexota bacterium]MBT7289305.1 NADH-quinone oxidoreductase subunit NuoE [Chloroflexota bacterium]
MADDVDVIRRGEILSGYSISRSNIIPILQAVQAEYGYLSKESIEAIAAYLHMSVSEVYGVSTFYAQFKFVPVGKKLIRLCRGTACHVRGVSRVLDEASKLLGIKDGETTEDMEYSLETIACFGSCALAPVMVVDQTVHGKVAPDEVKNILDKD